MYINNNSSVLSLFSSMNNNSNNKNSASGIYNNLSELASIRSGAYLKSAKKYYASNENKKQETQVVKPNKFDDIAKKTTSLVNTRSFAGKLKSATEDLMNNVAGTEDKNKLFESATAFVKNYNQAVSDGEESTYSSINNITASIKNNTDLYKDKLSDIGITVENNKMSIDEATFKKADIDSIKKVFGAEGGTYGYQTKLNAAMLDNAALTEATRSNTYNKQGGYAYNNNIGNLFTGMF